MIVPSCCVKSSSRARSKRDFMLSAHGTLRRRLARVMPDAPVRLEVCQIGDNWKHEGITDLHGE